jgi:hypothetical protein
VSHTLRVVISIVFGDYVGMARHTTKHMIAPVLLFSAAAAMMSACHKDEGGAAAPAVQVKPKAPATPNLGPSVAEQTATMVDAPAQGKSPLPVQLKFEVTQHPKMGQALDINLALIAQVDGSPAIIKVTGGDGLTVPSEASEFNIPAAAAGEIYRQTVKVTPAAEGVLLLGVTVSLKHDEQTDLKSFSIPLIADR